MKEKKIKQSKKLTAVLEKALLEGRTNTYEGKGINERVYVLQPADVSTVSTLDGQLDKYKAGDVIVFSFTLDMGLKYDSLCVNPSVNY